MYDHIHVITSSRQCGRSHVWILQLAHRTAETGFKFALSGYDVSLHYLYALRHRLSLLVSS